MRPTRAQRILQLAPPILLLSETVVFRRLAARFGPQRGYLGGFLVYWIVWCLALPLIVLGPRQWRQLFARGKRIGKLDAALLAGPILAPAITVLPGAARALTPRTALYSALFAAANGPLEEILWRGAYTRSFPKSCPKSWLWGTLYPSLGFGFWHLAPQRIYPYNGPGGEVGFALMAVALGLCWGWVARRADGSIRWVAVAHFLNNLAAPNGGLFVADQRDHRQPGSPPNVGPSSVAVER